KDHFIGLLNDSTRRSDPGSARFTTVEDGIQFALVVGKLLYLRLKFRFVGRRRSRRQRTGDVGLYRPAAACINLFYFNIAIDFLFQGGWRQIDGKEPQSAQVRMSGRRFLRTSQRGKQQSCHHDRNETIHLLVLLFCVGPPFIYGCPLSGLRSQPHTPDRSGTPPQSLFWTTPKNSGRREFPQPPPSAFIGCICKFQRNTVGKCNLLQVSVQGTIFGPDAFDLDRLSNRFGEISPVNADTAEPCWRIAF